MAERCEVTIVVENYVDIFLSSNEKVHYPVPGSYSQLWAEQGLSLFIEVFEKDKTIKILYDFGRSSEVIDHNLKILDIDPAQIDYLVLSHGHIDHFGGLKLMLERSKRGCKLIIDPEAYGRKRYIKVGDEKYAGPWEIPTDLVKSFHGEILEVEQSIDLGLGVTISGRIPRITSFERGMENAFVEDEKGLVQDSIFDEHAVFIEVKGYGIIIITGCCHAGIINTILEAESKFPDKHVYAILGGLHLNNVDSSKMNDTIYELKKRKLNFLSSFHCTGFFANKQLMESLEASWTPGCVGAKFYLGEDKFKYISK